MTDSANIARLREIDSNLRELARKKQPFTGSRLEELSVDLRGVILELEQPSAGTSAYEMVAAVEAQNIEVTETLISMVAATVLSKLIADEGGGRVNITFGPLDMDEMHRLYEMDAKRDGLLTTVTLSPRKNARTAEGKSLTVVDGAGIPTPLPPADAHLEAKPESLMTQDEPETPFEPQAEGVLHDRPLWAMRREGKLFPCSTRTNAENRVIVAEREGMVAQVENRFCYHQDCPTERCNHDARLNTTVDTGLDPAK